MDQLIEAFQIFRKYGNPQWPTHCEHDVMFVVISPEDVSEEDKQALEKLGFYGDGHEQCDNCFYSFKYGSA